MAQPFASRSYAGGKLPDRSVNANALPFSASSFSRHRGLGATTATAPNDFGAEGLKSQGAAGAAPLHAQTHGPGVGTGTGVGTGAGPSQETNPLNRLTEEQREEINEAVCIPPRPLRQTEIEMDSDTDTG